MYILILHSAKDNAIVWKENPLGDPRKDYSSHIMKKRQGMFHIVNYKICRKEFSILPYDSIYQQIIIVNLEISMWEYMA